MTADRMARGEAEQSGSRHPERRSGGSDPEGMVSGTAGL